MEIKIKVATQGALLSDKGPEIIQKGLDRAITEATLFLYREVIKRTPQGVYGAKGGLLGSIQHEVQAKGTPFVKGIVASAHKYAEVIEKGRTAGKKMPPAAIQSSDIKTRQLIVEGGLVQWIMLKFGVDLKKAVQLEFVVRRSIGRKGFEGRHMFEKALNDNFSKVQSIFEKQGLDIARELSE
jgi:hypothetical protein